jgi:MFS family permease
MAMTYSQTRGFGDRVVVALLLGAAVGMAGFVARQARAAEPLLALSLLREPLLCTGLAMSALVTTVMMSTLVLGPFFLSRALSLSAREVGLVMSAGPLVAALSAIPAGRVVDRIGARRTAAAGLVVFTLGALGMSLLAPAQGVPGYVLRMMLICAGYGFFQTPNNTAVMGGAPPDQRGLVSSLLALARNFGGITGGSLMGTIFATAIRASGPAAAGVAEASADAIARGMQTTFRVATALGLCALLLAVLPLYRRPAETKAA